MRTARSARARVAAAVAVALVSALGVLASPASSAGDELPPGIPDVSASRHYPPGPIIGNDVYAPTPQKVTKRLRAGAGATWLVHFGNDAPAGFYHRMVPKGCKSRGNFRVTYSYQGVDMTSVFTSGADVFPPLGGGGGGGVYLTIKVKAGTPVGAELNCAFSLRDVETGVKDTMTFVVVSRA